MRAEFYPNPPRRGICRALTSRLDTGDTLAMDAVLAIVACSPRLEVALEAGGAPPGTVALSGRTPRSELIVAAIDLLLRAAGLGPDAISGIAATRGPGSFTGVRVGLATAQGLAIARGAAARGFPSLLVQAARTADAEVLAVQPARRGSVYAQHHRRGTDGWSSVGEITVLPLESLADQPLPVAAPEDLGLPSGAVPAAHRVSAATALLEIFAATASPDPATLAPLYVEPPPAVPPSRTAPPWPPSPKAS